MLCRLLDEALPLLQEALHASRKTLGSLHPLTLSSVYNLAQLLDEMGNLEGAVRLYSEELEGCVAQYGPEPQAVPALSDRVCALY